MSMKAFLLYVHEQNKIIIEALHNGNPTKPNLHTVSPKQIFVSMPMYVDDICGHDSVGR